LRRLIQAATNKSERFNQFLHWVSFGGGALAAEGVRDEQRMFIKYNHPVANLLIFHNVVTMSKALERLIAEGYAVDLDLIACSSPNVTGHLNRFGRYELNRERMPEPLESIREFRMPPRGETNSRPAQVAV
jgi:Tn3 transposase DDE domain